MHGAARIQPAGRRLKLWWAEGRGEADPLAAPSIDRPINLFEPKDRGQMFTAGGLFTPSGELDEEERDDLQGAATGLTRNNQDHGGPRGSSDQRTAARYRACLDGFYSDPALVSGVLDNLPPISSMPQLIAFLKAAQMDEASPH